MKVAHVDCLSWSRGACREGRFGGKPSLEDCERRCPARKPRLGGPAVRWFDLPDEPEANPATWPELHRRALAFPGDQRAEREWLVDFAQRVPTKGCVCRSDWAIWTKANPAELSSAEAYFAWTVAAHNAVNVRIGKAIVPLEDAQRLWIE